MSVSTFKLPGDAGPPLMGIDGICGDGAWDEIWGSEDDVAGKLLGGGGTKEASGCSGGSCCDEDAGCGSWESKVEVSGRLLVTC